MAVSNAKQLRDRDGNLLIHQMYDAGRDVFQPYIPDWEDAISMSMIPDALRAVGIGFNPDIDTTSVPEDCWGFSGLYPWLTNPTMLQVRSTSTADSAGGTGMRTVSIPVLDTNYASAPVVITLNGTTPVPLPAAVLRINPPRGLTAGSAGTNVGDIMIEDVSGGTLRSIILAGYGVATQAPYTVPAGLTLFIPQLLLNINSPTGGVGKFVQMRTYFKGPNDACAITPLPLGTTNAGPHNHISKPPIRVAEKTDFSLIVSVTSDNNCVVTAGWNGYTRTNS